MFNLGHTISWTVLQLQMGVHKVTVRQKSMLHDNFFHGKGRISQPLRSFSSFCIVFWVVNKMKQASPLKSGTSQLACVHRRRVLYQELMFEQVLVFELTFTTEPSEQPTCKLALTCWSLVRTELKVNSGSSFINLRRRHCTV
jgi:hypothetical protein